MSPDQNGVSQLVLFPIQSAEREEGKEGECNGRWWEWWLFLLLLLRRRARFGRGQITDRRRYGQTRGPTRSSSERAEEPLPHRFPEASVARWSFCRGYCGYLPYIFLCGSFPEVCGAVVFQRVWHCGLLPERNVVLERFSMRESGIALWGDNDGRFQK